MNYINIDNDYKSNNIGIIALKGLLVYDPAILTTVLGRNHTNHYYQPNHYWWLADKCWGYRQMIIKKSEHKRNSNNNSNHQRLRIRGGVCWMLWSAPTCSSQFESKIPATNLPARQHLNAFQMPLDSTHHVISAMCSHLRFIIRAYQSRVRQDCVYTVAYRNSVFQLLFKHDYGSKLCTRSGHPEDEHKKKHGKSEY